MNIPGMPTGMKNPMTGEIMDPGKMPPVTVLIKGPRMLTETRIEQKGPKGTMNTVMSKLKQCDLGRELTYNNKSKKPQHTSIRNEAVDQGKPVSNQVGVTVTFKCPTRTLNATNTLLDADASKRNDD